MVDDVHTDVQISDEVGFVGVVHTAKDILIEEITGVLVDVFTIPVGGFRPVRMALWTQRH